MTTSANWAYIGDGDWMEVCDMAPPPSGGQVDVPLRDVAPMVIEVLKRDLLSAPEAALIIAAAENSLLRQADD